MNKENYQNTDLSKDPEIDIVLKALNHPLRRDILLFLYELQRACSFSEILETMNLSTKASGQFSYHLNLMIKANLILKLISKNNMYQLTKLGLHATSMLDLVNTSPQKSYVQSISKSFSDLTPNEQLYIALMGIPLGVFAYSTSFIEDISNISSFDIVFFVFSSIIFLLSFLLAYKILDSFLALFTLTNILWLIFLPNNHKYISTIYFFNLFGILLVLNGLLNNFNEILDFPLFLIGLGFFCIAIMTSYKFFKKENWV